MIRNGKEYRHTKKRLSGLEEEHRTSCLPLPPCCHL